MRPHSAVPAGRKKRLMPQKWQNEKTMNVHVERLFTNEDANSVEPAKHNWPNKKKSHYPKRLPQKILARLYGSKSGLLTDR